MTHAPLQHYVSTEMKKKKKTQFNRDQNKFDIIGLYANSARIYTFRRACMRAYLKKLMISCV